jgi:hypothetical protein
MFDRPHRGAALTLLLVFAACGKPMDRSGNEDATFVSASMAGTPAPTGPERPLASDLAVLPVSMLVTFNRLKTPEALQAELNKKPGTFSHLDLDKDAAPDPLTVAARETKQGHAFEIRARPSTGEFVVATMVFDPEWEFVGHYSGALGGAASTHARPLPANPLPGAQPTVAVAPTTPSPASTPTTPSAIGAPPVAAPAPTTSAPPAAAIAGGVQAVPAGSAQAPGVARP